MLPDPEFRCYKFNPQYNSVRRVGLEEFQSERTCPHGWFNYTHYKQAPGSGLSVCSPHYLKSSGMQPWGAILEAERQSLPTFDLVLLSIQN